MRNIIYFLLITLIFSSCRVISPEQMLRTPADYEFADTSNLQVNDQYRLAANDELSLRVYSNDGERLINPVETDNIRNNNNTITYNIEADGTIKVPVLGRVAISGLTIREAEELLEEKFKVYYNRPFVRLEVLNNRVIIFPGGEGGTSLVMTLENPNTTLFEALARAGGITDGKAHKVKLIRNIDGNPSVYQLDLSTIEGVNNANIVLQANDVIYVQPRNKVPQRILENLTPYLSLVTTALLIYSLFN